MVNDDLIASLTHAVITLKELYALPEAQEKSLGPLATRGAPHPKLPHPGRSAIPTSFLQWGCPPSTGVGAVPAPSPTSAKFTSPTLTMAAPADATTRPSPTSTTPPYKQPSDGILTDTNVVLPIVENIIKMYDYAISFCDYRRNRISKMFELIGNRHDPCSQENITQFGRMGNDYLDLLQELELPLQNLIKKYSIFQKDAQNYKVPKLLNLTFSPAISQDAFLKLVQSASSICSDALLLDWEDEDKVGSLVDNVMSGASKDFSHFCKIRSSIQEYEAKLFTGKNEKLEKAIPENRDIAEEFLTEWLKGGPELNQPDAGMKYRDLPHFPILNENDFEEGGVTRKDKAVPGGENHHGITALSSQVFDQHVHLPPPLVDWSAGGPSDTNVVIPILENIIRVYDYARSFCRYRKTRISKILKLLGHSRDACSKENILEFARIGEEYLEVLEELESLWKILMKNYSIFQKDFEKRGVPNFTGISDSKTFSLDVFMALISNASSVCSDATLLGWEDMDDLDSAIDHVPSDGRTDFTRFCKSRTSIQEHLSKLLRRQVKLEKAIANNRYKTDIFLRAWRKGDPKLNRPEAEEKYRKLPHFPKLNAYADEKKKTVHRGPKTTKSAKPRPTTKSADNRTCTSPSLLKGKTIDSDQSLTDHIGPPAVGERLEDVLANYEQIKNKAQDEIGSVRKQRDDLNKSFLAVKDLRDRKKSII